MRSKVIEDADVVTYVVVCGPGDEAVAAPEQFARAERPEASQVTAVGGFERATRPASCSRDGSCPATGNTCGGDRAGQGQERSCLPSQ